MDRLTREQRSRNMSRIRSRDTAPEMAVRRALFARGLRYRLQYPVAGRPDVAFPREKVAVMVSSCFFHRHEGCKYTTTPKSNTGFWRDKFASNVARDKRVTEELVAAGWAVLVIWECETKSDLDAAVDRVVAAVQDRRS